MKLKIIKAQKETPTYKSSVHRTGKIGFTIDGAKEFGITTEKSIIMAINGDDESDKCIYGILSDKGAEDAYLIQKGGEYHSIVAKGFFDFIKVDYSQGDLSYSLSKERIDNQSVIKFTPNPRKVIKKK